MKIKFFIQGQKLKRAKNDYIVADSKNFISADFEFSQEWTSLQKSAIFKNADTAYTVLLTDNECAVPYEVTGADFCVSVFGVGENMRITSDEIVIRVEETGYCEGETPIEPTQSVYEQIVERLSDAEDVHTQIEEKLLTKADAGEVTEALSLKADKEQTEAALSQKADKTQTEAAFGQKADKEETQSLLLTKADKTEVEEALALKADKNETQTALSQKANQEDLQQLNAEMSARCSAIETTHNEDIQNINNALDTKADTNMVQVVVNGLDERITNLVGSHSKDVNAIDETLGDIEASLDNKINKSEWELLEEIEMTEELSAEGVISFKRTLSAAYGITDISAVMLISIYPVDASVKYGIHNSINYKTEYEKPVNLFAWKPTLTTSSTGFCSYWQIVNKESGFVAQANLPNATRFFEAALSPLSNQEFSAMPIKEITQINVQSYEDSTTTKAIPKGSVFRIYGKGVVRNA